ncbi:MAG: hypothetical protein M1828_001797 [Chrysothrix sp. TS-e1954]|nr:MAG: hypothetical protein M1828_001797 [Chrysothrix sp. TS-e1954]
MAVSRIVVLCLALAAACSSTVGIEHSLNTRGKSSNDTGLTVDLGFKGIRYAQPPTGTLRWQAPRAPAVNRSGVIKAFEFGAICPQSDDNAPFDGATNGTFGSEDCLFLNVWAPPNARGLPVVAWIHGGGWGEGSAVGFDFSNMINANDAGLIGVSLQYRASERELILKLGAFGFLSSAEVAQYGRVNTGLLDQNFALQWIQSHIEAFGGDPRKVTIMGWDDPDPVIATTNSSGVGESAGAGSVMLHGLSYDGTLGDTLFQNLIAASPGLVTQYNYNDFVPTQAYMAFATHAGCAPTLPFGNSSQTIFDCLVSKPSEELQKADFLVSASGFSGSWAFLPVTDGVFSTGSPSTQLLKRKLNGNRLLVGSNAEEGPAFVPRDITTETALVNMLTRMFPLFSNNDIAKILLYYPSKNTSVDPNAPEYATLGYTGPTALNESQVATGQLQRAMDIWGEAFLVCPAYWLAEAYSDNEAAYMYQYSVPVATHGSDVSAYFGQPGVASQPASFQKAFMSIMGNFITKNDPSIPNKIANAGYNGTSDVVNPASAWPSWSIYSPRELILNQTGGVPFLTEGSQAPGVPHAVTEFRNPGLQNHFTLADAYSWEGGRGRRCDFWRSVAKVMPE